MNLYIKKWLSTQEHVSKCRHSIDPIHLFNYLITWCQEVKQTKDNFIKKLYDLYLSNYEKIDILEYSMDHLSNKFDEILEYDFLNKKPKDIEQTIILTRDILWNILSFKIDKECPSCRQGELRVLTDEFEKEIFISCDQCTYTENIMGQKINSDFTLRPAKRHLINGYQDMIK